MRSRFLDIDELLRGHAWHAWRHRQYPEMLTATDIDSLDGVVGDQYAWVEVEARTSRPLAVFEFKQNRWTTGMNLATRALYQLATDAGVPFYVIIYSTYDMGHRVIRVGADSDGWTFTAEELTERQYVEWLAELRGVTLPEGWALPPLERLPTMHERVQSLVREMIAEARMQESDNDVDTLRSVMTRLEEM